MSTNIKFEQIKKMALTNQSLLSRKAVPTRIAMKLKSMDLHVWFMAVMINLCFLVVLELLLRLNLQ